MATEVAPPPAPGSSARTVAYPRWVLLKHYGEEVDADSCPAVDAMTLAASRTSTGHHIGISLCLAAPPALSSVRIHLPRGVEGATGSVFVLAAHGDSLLIRAACYIEEEHHAGIPTLLEKRIFVRGC